jgi:hypothetical protein
MVAVTIIKRDAWGQEILRYQGTLRRRWPTALCLDATYRGPPADLGLFTLEDGDHMAEWFSSEHWFNVFHIQRGVGGAVLGWYCNITRPAIIDSLCVRADDLALDLVVAADGRTRVLDAEEFTALGLPPHEATAARTAMAVLRRLVATASGPFSRGAAGLPDPCPGLAGPAGRAL